MGWNKYRTRSTTSTPLIKRSRKLTAIDRYRMPHSGIGSRMNPPEVGAVVVQAAAAILPYLEGIRDLCAVTTVL